MQPTKDKGIFANGRNSCHARRSHHAGGERTLAKPRRWPALATLRMPPKAKGAQAKAQRGRELDLAANRDPQATLQRRIDDLVAALEGQGRFVPPPESAPSSITTDKGSTEKRRLRGNTKATRKAMRQMHLEVLEQRVVQLERLLAEEDGAEPAAAEGAGAGDGPQFIFGMEVPPGPWKGEGAAPRQPEPEPEPEPQAVGQAGAEPDATALPRRWAENLDESEFTFGSDPHAVRVRLSVVRPAAILAECNRADKRGQAAANDTDTTGLASWGMMPRYR